MGPHSKRLTEDTNGIENGRLDMIFGCMLKKVGDIPLTNKKCLCLRDNCDVVNLEFDNSSKLTRNG